MKTPACLVIRSSSRTCADMVSSCRVSGDFSLVAAASMQVGKLRELAREILKMQKPKDVEARVRGAIS